MRRLTPWIALLCLTPLSRGLAQGWQVRPATLPGVDRSEGSLVLRGTDHIVGARGSGHDGVAELVIACGATVPEAQGRVLFFRAAEPMEPFGEAGFARFGFDGTGRQRDAYLNLADRRRGFAAWPGTGILRLGFLGADESPFYSADLLHDLLRARTLTVTYLAFGEERRVTFELTGLEAALPRLGPCDWGR